jgi:hypothetical protein
MIYKFSLRVLCVFHQAVNAYYACYLYSSATEDLGRMAFMQLALTMEVQAVKYYWHMPNGSTIYDPIFRANTMAGNIGALGSTASTWFGDNPVSSSRLK